MLLMHLLPRHRIHDDSFLGGRESLVYYRFFGRISRKQFLLAAITRRSLGLYREYVLEPSLLVQHPGS